MTHTGLATMSRPLVAPQLPALTPTDLNAWKAAGSLSRVDAARLTAPTRYGLDSNLWVTSSLIEARLTGRALLAAQDCLIATMMDGIGFMLDRCRIGSIDRPDGTHRRPTEDGLRPCPLPGSPLTTLGSSISNCDIVNTDGRWYSNHMDGVQLWMGGRISLRYTKILGWWQSAIMAKTDWGPIDNIWVEGCHLGGANYFPVRIIDAGRGYGRPTNVTIVENVIERGVKGGANPMNSGNDMCSPASNTKYVRTEDERRDPTWIVFRDNVYPDGSEIIPPGGWI